MHAMNNMYWGEHGITTYCPSSMTLMNVDCVQDEQKCLLVAISEDMMMFFDRSRNDFQGLIVRRLLKSATM